MTRRAFGRLGLGALTGSFDYPWRLGIITDQVDPDLSYVLSSFYAKYRLNWTEIRYLKLAGKQRYVYADSTISQLKQVRQRLDDSGVKLSVLDTAIYKIALPGTTPVAGLPAYVSGTHEGLQQQMDDLKRAAEVAHTLGTDRIRIFTFRRVADPKVVFDRVVEELQRALTVAKSVDLRLLVENEYDTNVGTGEEIARFFTAIPNTRLMHNWDPCNVYEMGEQPFPMAWNQLDHSRISHIHLKDATGKEWKPIGAGKIDFAGQFEALKQVKYVGTMSLETRYRNSRQDAYRSSLESMDGLLRVLKTV